MTAAKLGGTGGGVGYDLTTSDAKCGGRRNKVVGCRVADPRLDWRFERARGSKEATLGDGKWRGEGGVGRVHDDGLGKGWEGCRRNWGRRNAGESRARVAVVAVLRCWLGEGVRSTANPSTRQRPWRQGRISGRRTCIDLFKRKGWSRTSRRPRAAPCQRRRGRSQCASRGRRSSGGRGRDGEKTSWGNEDSRLRAELGSGTESGEKEEEHAHSRMPKWDLR